LAVRAPISAGVGGEEHLHSCVDIVHEVKQSRLGRFGQNRGAELELSMVGGHQMEKMKTLMMVLMKSGWHQGIILLCHLLKNPKMQ
jgi:hypothetical protein